MIDKIIIDDKNKCPCYIDRPLHRYDKGCLIQSQVFSEQQTEEKPILRCNEIQNCPIKEIYKQLARKTEECEKLINKNNRLEEELNQIKLLLDGKNTQYEQKLKECEELKQKFFEMEDNFACEMQARLYHQNQWLKMSEQLQAEKQKVKELEEEVKQVQNENLNKIVDLIRKNGIADNIVFQLLDIESKKKEKYKQALEKIREINIDCKDCNGDCTFCMSGTNQEVYNISTETLGIKKDV